MVERIFCRPKFEFSRDQMSSSAPRVSPALVEVETVTGQIHSKTAVPDDLVGSESKPATFEFAANKFRQACQFSIKPISGFAEATVIDMVTRLEEAQDVAKIIHFLVPQT
jgi:hypothetical protein